MIPVLGVPILTRPDLLKRMLASIDVPIGRLVIVDNGHATIGMRLPRRSVVNPLSNLGVAASWNFVIRTNPGAPWWCLVNADIEFARGDLARLAAAMEGPEPKMASLVAFGAFGINGAAIDRVGWFDENYVPIYCEDVDYSYRMRLADVPVVGIDAKSSHVGSATIQNDWHRLQNDRTYPHNMAYYIKKWGGPIGNETYSTPFDGGGSWADWRLDRNRLADLAWVFPHP